MNYLKLLNDVDLKKEYEDWMFYLNSVKNENDAIGIYQARQQLNEIEKELQLRKESI